MGQVTQVDRCLSREPCPVVYGPVNSLRFGSSIGVNLGNSNRKNCSWACVYCQKVEAEVQPSIPAWTGMASTTEVMAEVRKALELFTRAEAMVFAGNGEPTLHPRFPEIVFGVKKLCSEMGIQKKLVCLTNGSQLSKPDVLEACLSLDETWVKLECAGQELFGELNLNGRSSGAFAEHLSNIGKLREPRIQTFLWRARMEGGQQNWTPENLKALLDAYQKIKPAEIHVMTASVADPFSPVLPVSFDNLDAFVLRVEECGLSVRLV